MNRIALVSLTGLFALSACSAGGFSPTSSPGNKLASASAFTTAPYSMPVTTSADAMAAERAAKATQRSGKGVGGQIPTITGILDFVDAPKFGPADQVNLAIVGVDAMSAGTAYPLVMYDKAVVINALNFKQSALQLGSNDIPAIAYDGLTLMVDPSQSNVVMNGKTYPMVFGTYPSHSNNFIPTGSATLATINFAMPFSAASGTVQLIMDFDANQSIDIVSNVAQVAPVLHGTTYGTAGVISGSVVNSAGGPVGSATVQAIAADGNVAATTSTAGGDGSFELHGIAGGTYQIVVSSSFTMPSGSIVTAQGADSSAVIAPLTVVVPSGYRLSIGSIQD
jgi:hypothetical protein